MRGNQLLFLSHIDISLPPSLSFLLPFPSLNINTIFKEIKHRGAHYTYKSVYEVKGPSMDPTKGCWWGDPKFRAKGLFRPVSLSLP